MTRENAEVDGLPADASLQTRLTREMKVLRRELPTLTERETLDLAIERVGSAVAVEYLAEIPAHAKWLRQGKAEFEQRLDEVWGPALNAFDVVVASCREYGSQFNSVHRATAVAENSFRFEVLVNLHARACRTALEVGVLLRSGYAKAALARWRSIHELAVVGSLIREGDETLAERYMLHDELDMHREMREYNKHCSALGAAPFGADELADALRRHDDLVTRFGNSYDQSNGWASELVKRPTWAALERLAGIDHLRPYYSWSSHGVHATPKGGRLTYIDNVDGPVLEVGPNTAGLADPASATLTSLTQITTWLLTWQPRMSDPGRSTWLLILRIISSVRDGADDELAAAHREHERRVAVNHPADASDR